MVDRLLLLSDAEADWLEDLMHHQRTQYPESDAYQLAIGVLAKLEAARKLAEQPPAVVTGDLRGKIASPPGNYVHHGDGTLKNPDRAVCIHCERLIIYLRMGDWWHIDGPLMYMRCDRSDLT